MGESVGDRALAIEFQNAFWCVSDGGTAVAAAARGAAGPALEQYILVYRSAVLALWEFYSLVWYNITRPGI